MSERHDWKLKHLFVDPVMVLQSKVVVERNDDGKPVKYRLNFAHSARRQEQKRLMERLGLKTGKAFRRWLKRERRKEAS